MNPLLINTHDKGGAATACLRLHKGLLQQDIASKVLLRNKSNIQIPDTYEIRQKKANKYFLKFVNKSSDILKKLKLPLLKDKLSEIRPAGLEMYSYPFSNYRINKSELYQQADIINLHWVANFLDYTSFFKNNNKSIVWTLHDQNPFLGVEHYAETIIGINNDGYPIKRKITKKEKEIFNRNLKIKSKTLNNFENLTIVSPSVWLSESAKQSELFYKYEVKTIPNGLDSNIFKPRDKQYSRELLNIPQNKTILLFVADTIYRKRKGFEFLQQILEKIQQENEIILLSIGSKNSNLEKRKNYIEFGVVNDELLMSLIYSTADVFIIPSLMDNLPNTVLESLMCGTPVIGFPVGGIPDMIQDGKNGYLTKEISVSSLQKTIEKFLEKPDAFNREIIRKNAIKKYDLQVQAKAYLELYKQIIDSSK